MRKEEALIIFVKNPVAGRVKTRLAKTMGPEKALEIYHKLLDYTRTITRPLAVDKQVWYSRYVEEDGWDPGFFEKKVQRGDELGHRMQQSFQENFCQGYEKVVIIGSDCAGLTTSLIEHAFLVLNDYDVVVGPSVDGGYYLLGMSSFCPQLFEDIAWSTSRVLEQTQEKIKEYGLRSCLLYELNDVDNEDDWQEVRERF